MLSPRDDAYWWFALAWTLVFWAIWVFFAVRSHRERPSDFDLWLSIAAAGLIASIVGFLWWATFPFLVLVTAIWAVARKVQD